MIHSNHPLLDTFSIQCGAKLNPPSFACQVLSDKHNYGHNKGYRKAISLSTLYNSLSKEIGANVIEKQTKDEGVVKEVASLSPQQKTHIKKVVSKMITDGEIEHPFPENSRWICVSAAASPASSPTKHKKASPKKKATPTKATPKKKTTPKKATPKKATRQKAKAKAPLKQKTPKKGSKKGEHMVEETASESDSVSSE